MLLTTAYFPPVSWFAAVAKSFTLSPDRVIPSVVWLEACENYQKQSWRNRCRILTAGGTEDLRVPVVHEGGTYQLPIRQIRVDYTEPWVVRTQRAIDSAYESSAYYEYYRDEVFALMDRRPETLWELNLSLIRFFLAKTGIAADIRLTESWEREAAGEDLRYVIHPKRPDPVLARLGLEKPYFQVFSGKFGFQPNLSVMDLLFNEGPDSILWLKTLS